MMSKQVDEGSTDAMSFKSKRTITTMAAGLALLIGYLILAIDRSEPGPGSPEALRSWALTLLVFLVIAAVVLTAVQFAFHIAMAGRITATEGGGDSARGLRILSSAMAEDEMDKLIGLTAARIGYLCFGVGFVGMLATLALGGSAVAALHVQFGAFAVGSLVAGAVSVYGYERGVRHG